MKSRLLKFCLIVVISSSALIATVTSDDEDSKPCDDGRGECVQFYQCEDGKIITDGADIIDVRGGDDNECNDIYLTCCHDEFASRSKLPPGTGMISNKCGFRNVNGVGFQTIGGLDNETQYGEFPWMLALLREELIADEVLSVYECGASLITDRVALTAAHCVYNKSLNNLKVRAGEYDTSSKNEIFDSIEFKVKEIIIHENFMRRNLFNDVALLILEAPLKAAENINTICLPPQDSNFDGKRCYVAGWGKNEFGKHSKYNNILKRVYVPMVTFAKCQEKLRKTRLGKRFILDSSFVCAGDETADTCKGDGGSPLMCEIDDHPGHYYQAGIVAWGIECKSETPGVYVNVAKFRNWIDQKIRSKNLTPSSSLNYII